MGLKKIEELLERIAIAVETSLDVQEAGTWIEGRKEEDTPIKVLINSHTRLMQVEEEANRKSSAEKKRLVVATIKKLKKKGCTYKEIAETLNEKGVKTFSGGGLWYPQTVHRLVKS